MLSMGFIYVLIGFSTIWLFMFKIEWLFERKAFIINIFYNIVLIILSFSMLYFNVGNPKYVVILQLPLLSSIIFFVLYEIFKILYKRDPENTAWAMTGKPVEDVVFSMLFWILAGSSIMIIA